MTHCYYAWQNTHGRPPSRASRRCLRAATASRLTGSGSPASSVSAASSGAMSTSRAAATTRSRLACRKRSSTWRTYCPMRPRPSSSCGTNLRRHAKVMVNHWTLKVYRGHVSLLPMCRACVKYWRAGWRALSLNMPCPRGDLYLVRHIHRHALLCLYAICRPWVKHCCLQTGAELRLLRKLRGYVTYPREAAWPSKCWAPLQMRWNCSNCESSSGTAGFRRCSMKLAASLGHTMAPSSAIRSPSLLKAASVEPTSPQYQISLGLQKALLPPHATMWHFSMHIRCFMLPSTGGILSLM